MKCTELIDERNVALEVGEGEDFDTVVLEFIYKNPITTTNDRDIISILLGSSSKVENIALCAPEVRLSYAVNNLHLKALTITILSYIVRKEKSGGSHGKSRWGHLR